MAGLAGIPSNLWAEYYTVAKCESGLNTEAIGDNGSAKGLLQIHYHYWLKWAASQDKVFFGNKWSNPIHNLQLAYLIQEEYDLPRHRWEQSWWSAKPYFNC